VKDFSNVADLLPEPMVVVDPQSGSLLGVNAAAKRILDLQRGSEWLTRVQDVDALIAFLSEARRVRQMLPGSLVIETQSELSRHRISAARMDRSSPAKVLMRIGPSEMDRRLKTLNSRLAVVQVDLQARQRALMLEQRMQETQKLESLGVLAGGIAHDFNNLLVGVLGNIGLARMELPAVAPASAFLRDAEHASQRAAELCRQLLAYSGRGRFVIEMLDVSELVRDMAHLVEVSISKRAVIRRSLQADLPAVEGDATQLRQVVLNLITNSSDAFGDSDGVITVATSSRMAERAYLDAHHGGMELPEGHYVEIEISDTGPGMEPKVASRIFEPFFSTKATGSGLGLAAVRGIVRSHGGALRVYSELGHGTAIRVILPAGVGTVPEQAPEPPAKPLASIVGKLIVADDQPMVREVASRVLRKLGVEVLLAKDGAEALELYAEHRDQVWGVLLDMTMPRVSGEQVFKELRLLDPTLRIVLSSGYSEAEIRAQLAGRQPTAFLGKPWTPSELLEVFAKMMEPT
jgi:signal transduction histidine kinase